jgi:hypothetical protein
MSKKPPHGQKDPTSVPLPTSSPKRIEPPPAELPQNPPTENTQEIPSINEGPQATLPRPPLPHSLAFIVQEIGHWGGPNALSGLFVLWLRDGRNPEVALRKYASKRAINLGLKVDEYLRKLEQFYELLNL